MQLDQRWKQWHLLLRGQLLFWSVCHKATKIVRAVGQVIFVPFLFFVLICWKYPQYVHLTVLFVAVLIEKLLFIILIFHSFLYAVTVYITYHLVIQTICFDVSCFLAQYQWNELKFRPDAILWNYDCFAATYRPIVSYLSVQVTWPVIMMQPGDHDVILLLNNFRHNCCFRSTVFLLHM